MKIKNILLVYKKSAYQIYFAERKRSFLKRKGYVRKKDLARFKQAHEEHSKTLCHIESVLCHMGLRYKKRCRNRRIDCTGHDFVISVGGDGTFLESARSMTSQVILGVNSNPALSTGKFCSTNRHSFQNKMKQILSDKIFPRTFSRLKLKVDKFPSINILNDIFVCHKNPAAMSRYQLTIDRITEEHRSSGIRIATAAGSSGAIRSAGGHTMNPHSTNIQYRPRELNKGYRSKSKFKGGIIKSHQCITVRSLMRNGCIYADGAHVTYPFSFGSIARIKHSRKSLKVI